MFAVQSLFRYIPANKQDSEAATDPQNCDTDDGAVSCLLDSEDSVNGTTARVDEHDLRGGLGKNRKILLEILLLVHLQPVQVLPHRPHIVIEYYYLMNVI